VRGGKVLIGGREREDSVDGERREGKERFLCTNREL